jgi:hypothetical protein
MSEVRDVVQGSPAATGLSPCPSCGKPIESVPFCYYCCAATAAERRVSERKLALVAAGTLLLGVLLLALAAGRETPVTPVSDLSPTGAFLHYRVQGTVSKAYLTGTPYPDSDVYQFWVSDASVDDREVLPLKVKVEGPIYLDLVAAGDVPRQGDVVDVEGTLYAGPEFRILNVNVAPMVRLLERKGR